MVFLPGGDAGLRSGWTVEPEFDDPYAPVFVTHGRWRCFPVPLLGPDPPISDHAQVAAMVWRPIGPHPLVCRGDARLLRQLNS